MAMFDWHEMKGELKVLVKLGWPMTVSVLFYALIYPATLAFCGSQGLLELDIASLGVSVFQLVVVPIENGLRWSCLTFFSQAMGGSKRMRAGIIVQRSLTAAVCMWIISCGIAINCANLLVLIGQDPEIAVGSQTFITILIPGCLAILIFRVLMAYMDCLQRVYPSLIMHMLAFFLCLGLEALFMFKFQMGAYGAAVGLSISLCCLPFMMVGYMLVSKVYVDTWPGWSARCLLNWKDYYYNLFPSIANQLVFVFSSELGTFVAGSLGKSQLAVQGIMFQLFIVTLQPCVGAGSAAISRIGNHMGAGRYEKGKMVYKLVLVLLALIGAILAVLLFALKDLIPKIFSADAATAKLFGEIIYFVIPYTFFVSSAWGHIAALRGCNYHNLCVIIAIVALWVIGHPIGLSLTFAASWGMYGLWTGYTVSSMFWNVFGLFFAARLKWQSVSEAVSGFAENETDVEGFVTHDETRPLLKPKTQQKPPDWTLMDDKDEEQENHHHHDHQHDHQKKQKKTKMSLPRILKTKIAPALFLICYIAAAVTLRCTLPQPQYQTEQNITDVTDVTSAFNVTTMLPL